MEALLERRIKEKNETDRITYYQKNIAMVNITREYIKRKKLLLYGGLALNSILPAHKRFYDQYEVPDYDFFSPNALKHGKELADKYAKLGYKNIELKPGLHSGTVKLYVDYIAIADITSIPKVLYARMTQISSEERDLVLRNNPGLDLFIAPFDFLRLSLHLELSRPNGFIDRWSKIYSRMVLFYKTYPLKYESCLEEMKLFDEETDTMYLKLVDETRLYLTMNLYPAFGSEVLKIYIREAGFKIPNSFIWDTNMTAYDIVSEDYENAAKTLFHRLTKICGKDVSLQKQAALYNSELIPVHYLLKYKDRPLVGIYKSQACYSYKEIEGMRIMTIDACLSFAYGWLLSNREYYNKEKVKCGINILLNIQKIQMRKPFLRNKLFVPFEIKCYGYQVTLEDMKRAKFEKNNNFKVYRPKKI